MNGCSQMTLETSKIRLESTEDDFSGDSDLSEDEDVDPYYGYYEEVSQNSKSSHRSKEQHKNQKYM